LNKELYVIRKGPMVPISPLPRTCKPLRAAQQNHSVIDVTVSSSQNRRRIRRETLFTVLATLIKIKRNICIDDKDASCGVNCLWSYYSQIY